MPDALLRFSRQELAFQTDPLPKLLTQDTSEAPSQTNKAYCEPTQWGSLSGGAPSGPGAFRPRSTVLAKLDSFASSFGHQDSSRCRVALGPAPNNAG